LNLRTFIDNSFLKIVDSGQQIFSGSLTVVLQHALQNMLKHPVLIKKRERPFFSLFSAVKSV